MAASKLPGSASTIIRVPSTLVENSRLLTPPAPSAMTPDDQVELMIGQPLDRRFDARRGFDFNLRVELASQQRLSPALFFAYENSHHIFLFGSDMTQEFIYS